MEENSIEVSSKSSFLAYFEKYMIIVGVLGQAIFYAQGVKIFLNQSAKDVSLVGFSFGLLAAASWLTYGFLIKNKVLITANVIAVIGALFVIAGVFIHG